MADVIILEDDVFLAPLLAASLEDAGHSVRLFDSAARAVESYTDIPCDVLVADIIIRKNDRPVPDGGLIAIHRIKTLALESERPILIIAISGAVSHIGMQDILQYAADLGAHTVLSKPFTPDELLDVIEEHPFP